ncbi:GGDEF domain-containing protein [Nautilia sp.]
MRSKIYILVIVLFSLIIGISFYESVQSINTFIKEESKQHYKIRSKEYNVFYQNKKTFLNSFAKFLSSSEQVKKAYLENNRTLLINYVKPLYENLYPNHIIEEIHFFKKPAISYVNFANLKKYNFSVAKARADIVWINTSFSPSIHFYVCRLYPGLRATYPIIYKDRLLGSVSFGIHINEFKKLFEKAGAREVTIYLNDTTLKKMLLPAKYEFYKKLPLYYGYRVLGKPFENISLKEGYQTLHHCVYTKIKITDFFENTMAYLVIRDNLGETVDTVSNVLKEKTIVEILSFFIIFAIIFIIFKWLFDKLNEINWILYYIKTHKFDKIPKKTKEKDELDVYKNNLIDVAQRIKAYINLLNSEIEEYSAKAYQDVLTKTLNRNFLEEKADELFIKFELSKKPVGIIMLDIDNFKKVNDTYGHDVGDMVLIKLAETIKTDIRKEDLFIRYGGEEFLIILPNSNIENTYIVAEKIRKHIEDITLEIGHKHLKFTISLGISEIREGDISIFDAIKRADINLYEAKRNGKNRVEI